MKANRFIRVQLCPSVTLILPLSQQFERFSPNGDFESVNSDIRVKSGRLAHGFRDGDLGPASPTWWVEFAQHLF
jgi:hypothetical protein